MWDAAAFHGRDGLWTVITWSTFGENSIPASWIHTKHEKVIALLQGEDDWDVLYKLGPQTMIAARRFCTNCDDHDDVVDSILDIYDDDKLSISTIHVYDCRGEVIGSQYPTGVFPPVVKMNELLRGDRTCFPIHSEGLRCDGQVKWTRFTLTDPATQGGEMYYGVVCTEKIDSPEKLYYIIGDHLSDIPQHPPISVADPGIPWYQRVEAARELHMKWMRDGCKISKLAFFSLNKTYGLDDTLMPSVRERMEDFLYNIFSLCERDRYFLGQPSSMWKMLTIDKRMEATHDEHDDWLDRQMFIDHHAHHFLMEMYITDRFLKKERKDFFKWKANEKFLSYITNKDKKADDDQDYRDALRYWCVLKPKDEQCIE